MAELYVLTDAKTNLGECPTWDVEQERLYWVGVLEGLIFSSTADGREIRVWKFPGPINSFALRESGGAIITSMTSAYLFDFDTGATQKVFDADLGPNMNSNDGKVDRQGRFVFGLSDRNLARYEASSDLIGAVEPDGCYYRIDDDLSAHRLVGNFGITNGPCFSPDGSTFYCNDSWTRRVYAFDYDPASGSASNRRMLAAFDDHTPAPEVPRPDGATVDEDGFIWVAAVYGGEIRRYSPEGVLERRIGFPLPKPTSVAFGGPSLDVLYVTSMASRGSELDGTVDAGPLAGSVVAIRGLGVRGIPEKRFAG